MKRLIVNLMVVSCLLVFVVAPASSAEAAAITPGTPRASSCAKGQSIQDPFLNTLRKERTPVAIYLVNGIKLQGQIDSFDQSVIFLKNGVTQMVYKHAISTVVPARNVRLPSEGGAVDGADPLY